jgi:Hemocyanin, ig-like domain
LEFTGVRVTGVEVSTPAAPQNVIETFWQKNVVDLSRGMDFNPRGSVLAKFTHLNHKDFQMRINVRGANFQNDTFINYLFYSG